MDRLGNVYFTSRFDNARKGVDFANGVATDIRKGPGIFLSRVNADGAYAWTLCMTQALSAITSRGFDVAIDGQGDAILAGVFEDIIDFDPGPGTVLAATTNYFESFLCKLRGADRTARGTPAWWLAGFGLKDDDDDRDDDGAPAWSEYRADTSPLAGTSVLRLTQLTWTDGHPDIGWQGGVAATQILEFRDGLDPLSEWMPLCTNLPPTPPATNFVDRAAGTSTRFYRVSAHR